MSDLVLTLEGITSRYKQMIAFCLTGSPFHADTVKNEIALTIQECERIGLQVDAVISDMGVGNQALWRLFSIVVDKHSRWKT